MSDSNATGSRVLAFRTLAGPIERKEEGGEVRYTQIKILSRGKWTDASSGVPTLYEPKNLEVQEDNTVNIMHDSGNDVSAVGRIDAESVTVEDGDMYADVVLHMDSAASEYADENLQQTLESGGEVGFGGPSVEIPAEGLVIEDDEATGVPKTMDGKIDGMGFVAQPAAKTTAFSQQTAERQVALASGDSDSGSTDKSLYVQERSMSDETRSKIRQEILSRELEAENVQEHAEMIAEDVDASVADVMELLDPLMGEEMGDYGDDKDKDDEEDTDMQDGEDGEEPEGEESDDEEDMEMEDDQAAQVEGMLEVLEEDINDLWDALEDLKGSMMSSDDVDSELSATKEELEKELAEVKEELEAKDKRLSAIEDEPTESKSLADGEGDEPDWDSVTSIKPPSTPF